MYRLALSLSLFLVMAPAARAEGNRSLGLTVSPVGIYAIGASQGVSTGYSVNLGWSFGRSDSRLSVGGHLASCLLFTEATPLGLRYTLLPQGRFRPYLGVGASLVVPHSGKGVLAVSSSPLRLGGELAAGLQISLTRDVGLEAQGRLQSFPFAGGPVLSRQLELAAAYVGVGFRI